MISIDDFVYEVLQHSHSLDAQEGSGPEKLQRLLATWGSTQLAWPPDLEHLADLEKATPAVIETAYQAWRYIEEFYAEGPTGFRRDVIRPAWEKISKMYNKHALPGNRKHSEVRSVIAPLIKGRELPPALSDLLAESTFNPPLTRFAQPEQTASAVIGETLYHAWYAFNFRGLMLRHEPEEV